MTKAGQVIPPPDLAERDKALDPRISVLVRAPAGSGKTTLLTERFLRLLAEVDDPGQVVAITFTEAAAAEMRNRVLDRLSKNQPDPAARVALEHSQRLGWNLLDLPAQLRITTIDAFCRELALQQPLVSGLGGGLDIAEQPAELYRRAAQRTLQQIGGHDHALSQAIEHLLLWRDNNWMEIESLLAEMLESRDRWMQEFLLDRNPDWNSLRAALEGALARASHGDSPRYTDPEWAIVRACFLVLRHALGQLRVIFSETGRVDFSEVAQIALGVLKGSDGQPAEAALVVADGIRHLLVDEFQDTSRRQHQLLANLVRAWPDREQRTSFVVGDPMQSIYFFRDADAELFPRVERLGLEIPDDQPLRFEPVQLTANFRSAPELVEHINHTFSQVFAKDDGSGVGFTPALPARDNIAAPGPHLIAAPSPHMQLHVEFVPKTASGSQKAQAAAERKAARQEQIQQVVTLIRSHLPRIAQARAGGEKYRLAVLGRTRNALAPIASALREAAVTFRAVELEELKERPEIVDALALARALLNWDDRVAWLGVLRAPWCGLSLSDLHLLVSADEVGLQSRPVPELLRERLHLLGEQGRAAAARVIGALEFSQQLRSAQPTLSTATWLEQVWLRLGGAQCVDDAARANLDLLWGRIDRLPDGEPDLLGPALDAALRELKARPDPAVDGDCGVQLMTIHKSKGLEFEVVIVPELQGREEVPRGEMLSWLERGLAADDQSGELTEFLIAPLKAKGDQGGKARTFVSRARREREQQELRRLLYVAATRAKEELHLFARVEYKNDKDGTLVLVDPPNSLLATSWPAFAADIRRRFQRWTAARIEGFVDLAAQKEDLPAARESRPFAIVRRLPPEFTVPVESSRGSIDEQLLAGAGRLYERHEGGLLSRSLGRAAHAFLEELARHMAAQPRSGALAALSGFLPCVTAQIRSAGVETKHAERIARQALEVAQRAAADPVGAWILAPHPDAASEVRWTGVIDGNLRTVQVDRVFRGAATPDANLLPHDPGVWWIIDYKMAYEEGIVALAALPELRRTFAPQIEAYARVLRNLQGSEAQIHGGLYYPRMGLFDWWQI